MLKVRDDIHELSNDEVASALDELSLIMAQELAAPRTAELLAEVAKRLRDGSRR